MKTFDLSAKVTIGIYTTVEANSLEEAIEIAEKRHIETAWLNSSSRQAKEVWVSEGFDGMPVNIKEDK